jgi:hypothetical protein
MSAMLIILLLSHKKNFAQTIKAIFFYTIYQMGDACAEMKKCESDPNTRMRCTVESGQKVWKGVAIDDTTTPQGTCPGSCDSIPWRKKALCRPPTKETCYSTIVDHNPVIVCLTPSSYTAQMTPSADGMRSLRYAEPISPDRELSDEERAAMLPKFTACYAQPFKELHNSSLVTYVEKEKSAACDDLIKGAGNSCRLSGHSEQACAEMIIPLYKNEKEDPYKCILDTNRLPVAHKYQKDSHAWWRWVRHNQYDCRIGQWKCEDAQLSEYSGGMTCGKDADCTTTFEAGVCDLKDGKCLAGHSKGGRCASHEECDHVHGEIGKCGSNGRCAEGKTGIDAAYFIPDECPPSSDKTGHRFCGKVEDSGETFYTGVCTAYKFGGKEFTGCRAFEDEADIDTVKRAEQEYQHLYNADNFHPSLTEWERLRVCPEKDWIQMDDHRVCRHTTRTIQLANGSVPASNRAEAEGRCDLKSCKDTNCASPMCDGDEAGNCSVAMPSHIAASEE